jgi:hypothetical protein
MEFMLIPIRGSENESKRMAVSRSPRVSKGSIGLGGLLTVGPRHLFEISDPRSEICDLKVKHVAFAESGSTARRAAMCSDLLTSMSDVMTHRALTIPADWFLMKPVADGFRRLSITTSPPSSADAAARIAFGWFLMVIYNHASLREDLNRGHVYGSRTDSKHSPSLRRAWPRLCP